jgi:hypothetical protein
MSVSRPKALSLSLLVFAVVFSFIAAGSSEAGSITLYSNSLKSASGRAQIVKAGPGNCRRGGSRDALRFTAGKRTKACSYATPVVGRDLEVTVTGRIFKTVPSRLRESMFVAANLRQARDGSKYQLAVFPTGRRFQLRKILPDGRTRILKADRNVGSVRRFGEPNRVRLRAYNGVKGKPGSTARLVAIVNGRTLAVVDDARGNELDGRDSGFSISTTKKAVAPGTSGSFSGVLIRIPNPF